MKTLYYDIVINGGSLGAVSAALTAARNGKELKILLLEPTDRLGGQAVTQGVAAIDYAHHEPARSLLAEHPDRYLPTLYRQWIRRVKKDNAEREGFGYGGKECCWVSRDCFDPRSADAELKKMGQEFPNLDIAFMTVVKKAETSTISDEYGNGVLINSLQLIKRTPRQSVHPFGRLLSRQMPDWFSPDSDDCFTKEQLQILPENNCLTVVDASEWGDVICLSGAEYTVGRELEKEEESYGELPGMNEKGTQSFVFPFCQGTGTNPNEGAFIRELYPDIEEYYQQQSKEFFSFNEFTWQKIWTYRRLKNTGQAGDFDTPHPGDITMQNWYPGNDYPYGSLFKSRSEAENEGGDWRGGLDYKQIAAAEKHALAFHLYYKNNVDKSFPVQYLFGNNIQNMMGTGHGLSPLPYFRGTRRIVGLHRFRITEKYYNTTENTSYRFYDTVGIGNYTADIHPVITGNYGVSPRIEKPRPFYIPYRALGSSNVRNLLAAGKNFAQTYITNAAYRLHPIEWAAGTAAGIAAVLLSNKGLTNYALLEKDNLFTLQQAVSREAPLHWEAFDETIFPEEKEEIFIRPRWLEQSDNLKTIEIFFPQASALRLQTEDEPEKTLPARQGKVIITMNTSQLSKTHHFEWLDRNSRVLHRVRRRLSF